jgi:hypothetical protein
MLRNYRFSRTVFSILWIFVSSHLKYIIIMKKLEFLHVVLRCTAATVSAGSILRSAGDKLKVTHCLSHFTTRKGRRNR